MRRDAHRHVLGDPEQADEALEPAVLGDVADPGGECRVRPAGRQRLTVEADRTGLVFVRPHDHPPERRHAGTQQSRETDALAGVHGQRGAQQ